MSRVGRLIPELYFYRLQRQGETHSQLVERLRAQAAAANMEYRYYVVNQAIWDEREFQDQQQIQREIQRRQQEEEEDKVEQDQNFKEYWKICEDFLNSKIQNSLPNIANYYRNQREKNDE